MPSTNTITSSDLSTFSPSTVIKSAEVNNNFSVWRGHILPVDPTTSAAANNSYDVGSSSYQWKDIYFSGNLIDNGSTVTSIYNKSTSGNPSSPSTITASSSISIAGSDEEIIWLIGDTNTGTTINTGTAQLATATSIGQKVTLIGTSDTNVVNLRDDADLLKMNGDFTLYEYSAITFIWDTTNWTEIGRRN